MSKAVVLKSLGCRTNQEEMMTLSSRLTQSGHSIVESVEQADIAIVNTCLVTAHTEAKARRMIAAILRLRPGIKICVTGCLAQHAPLDIREKMAVTWVVGNNFKQNIPDILADLGGGVYHDDIGVRTSGSLGILLPTMSPGESNKTRFCLKIQEGCDLACAYCVVPLVRGPSRSANGADVERAFERAVSLGYKEIVITGTHIGQYKGQCPSGTENLYDMLQRCVDHDGDFRIRLSSLDPRDLSDGLLEMIGAHPRMCRHCHVSVQSLSAPVLSAMDRPMASLDSFVDRLASFHRRFPEVGIGGDFIVGFPGETDDMLAETVAGVERVGFSYGHVFRYSRRPGTKAVLMDGHIDGKEKNRRSRLLRSSLDACHGTFVSNAMRAVQKVLVESEHPSGGLASNYLRLDVQGSDAPKNTWLDAVITGIDPESGRLSAVPAGA